MASFAPRPWLVFLCFFSICLNVCSALNYRDKFAWVDDSCRGYSDSLNPAVEELRALSIESYYAMSDNPMKSVAKETMKRLFDPPRRDRATLEGRFEKMRNLGRDGPMPYYLYCGISAFVFVDKYLEGPKKGQRRPQNEWYFYAKRSPPGKVISWRSRSGINPCMDDQGRGERDAFAFENHNMLVLCPSAWEKSPSLLCEENVEQDRGTSIDYMQTMGSIMYHELTHLRLGTEDWAYGFSDCLDLARRDPQKAIDNADSMTYFSMAMLYRKNVWYSGVARPLPRS